MEVGCLFQGVSISPEVVIAIFRARMSIVVASAMVGLDQMLHPRAQRRILFCCLWITYRVKHSDCREVSLVSGIRKEPFQNRNVGIN